MIFRGRKLSEITAKDLRRLIEDEVQEGDTLEYKHAMYGGSDDEKREMLKHISSMANHLGGYLIIGIEEDAEGNPTNLGGIQKGNHVERVVGSCLDNIAKRIIGLEVEDVPLPNGNVIVVVFIPESTDAPHMVTFKGLNQFWKRHGRQKGKMTIYEIEQQFERKGKAKIVVLGERLLGEFEGVLVSWIYNFSVLMRCPQTLFVKGLPGNIEAELSYWFASLQSTEAQQQYADFDPKQWQVVIGNISGLKWRLEYFKERFLHISVLLQVTGRDSVPRW